MQFIREWQKSETSMAALCRAFGISRQTGYKWVRRYFEFEEEGDPALLQDRSRRPLTSPTAVDEAVVDLIIRARKARPHWGPRKLHAWLGERYTMPAASTIGEILKRHGLVKRRRRRVHTPPYTKPFAQCSAPNSVWCVDFKGHFKTRDGVRCYPLTIMDAFSRFLIRCEGVLDPDAENVLPIFESAFREFGLPAAIRSDNGPPFASTGAGGLTSLSVWWLKLGIAHERIAPGKPQQNGRHERMHRTLKQETAMPPRADLRAQQRAFDLFRRVYNEERPHEALDQRAPTTEYAPSTRQFFDPSRASFRKIDIEQVLVDRDGFIRWGRAKILIARALADELVDFYPAGDRQWEVRFGQVPLGIIDETRIAKGLIRPKQRKRPQEVSTMSPV